MNLASRRALALVLFLCFTISACDLFKSTDHEQSDQKPQVIVTPELSSTRPTICHVKAETTGESYSDINVTVVFIDKNGKAVDVPLRIGSITKEQPHGDSIGLPIKSELREEEIVKCQVSAVRNGPIAGGGTVLKFKPVGEGTPNPTPSPR